MAALTALAIGSLIVGAVGTGLAYKGQKDAAKTTAAVGEYNAKISEADAAQLDMEARETLRRRREANTSFLSSQRSKYVASGVVADTGTPLEVQAETAGILELDALDQARQARVQAQRLRTGAVVERITGQAQARAYNTAAGVSLLQGAASAMRGGASLYNSGAFGGG